MANDGLDGLLRRIERDAGSPGLADALTRLRFSDLQALLLEVFRRRAAEMSPESLLRAYEQNRFVRPASVSATRLAELDVTALTLLQEMGYGVVEPSPVAAFGTVSALATVDQNNVVSALRGCEVMSDVTNALALECAVRRRNLLRVEPRSSEPVQVSAVARVVRGQHYGASGVPPHFRLLGLCTAGRDEGSLRFERRSLLEHLTAHLRLVARFRAAGIAVQTVRVSLTDLRDKQHRSTWDSVLVDLRNEFPAVKFEHDDTGATGGDYYEHLRFHVHAELSSGAEVELSDGGFTTWTRQLLGNAKERLLVSGMGLERLGAEPSLT
jgi:hypothetical protein